MSDNLYESLRMENASLNNLYNNALSKMKKMQNEYELLYLNYLNENQQRENNLKNNYNKYQNLFQKQFEKEEQNYLEEIKSLKIEINNKNKIIDILQKNNAQLKDKLSKNEFVFNLKEKEYQKELLKKDRLLIKSSDVVKKNSKEVMEDIQKLKDELYCFQNKIFMNKMNNNNKTINNNPNIKNLKSNFSNYKINKNSDINDLNDILICNCNCHKYENYNPNKSFYSTKSPNLKQSQISLINTNGNKKYQFEIKSLRYRINYLNSVIKKKDEEILFWKNLRRKLTGGNSILNTCDYKKNTHNFNFETRNKSINHMTSISNTISNKKNERKNHSQSASHIRPMAKKIKLDLVDSNINKPTIKKNISSDENKQ